MAHEAFRVLANPDRRKAYDSQFYAITEMAKALGWQ